MFCLTSHGGYNFLKNPALKISNCWLLLFSSLLFSSLLFYPYYHPYPLPPQRLKCEPGRRLEDFAQRGCAKANGRMQAESRQAYFNIVIHLLTMFLKTKR